MLADPDLFVVLEQQLSPNDVAILGDDTHEAIDTSHARGRLRTTCDLAFRCSDRESVSYTAVDCGFLAGLLFTSDVTSTSCFMLTPLLEYCTWIFLCCLC